MTKKKLSAPLPFLILGGILIYCWTVLISTDLLATLRHYLGLTMYLILLVLFLKRPFYALVGLGIYLLFATFALLAITPEITTNWIGVGPVSTPPVNLLSLGMFVLYSILNFNILVDAYLDHKESRDETKKTSVSNIDPLKELKHKP